MLETLDDIPNADQPALKCLLALDLLALLQLLHFLCQLNISSTNFIQTWAQSMKLLSLRLQFLSYVISVACLCTTALIDHCASFRLSTSELQQSHQTRCLLS